MKAETKKLIITIINVLIFIGNAIISYLSGGGTTEAVAVVTTGTLALATAIL